MGLHEVSRAAIFGNQSQHVARVIVNQATSSISSWVATNAQGDVALFELIGGEDINGVQNVSWTVVGFKLPAALPDFEIHHQGLLTRLAKRFSGAAAGRTPGQPVVRVSGVKVGGLTFGGLDTRAPQARMDLAAHPAFAEKYVVWASDPATTARVLTPAFMDELVQMSATNIHMCTGLGWLFVYHFGERAVAPEKYPALFDEAVGLLSKLNLQPTPARADEPPAAASSD